MQNSPAPVNSTKLTRQFSKAFVLVLTYTLLSGAVRKWGTSNGLLNNILLATQLSIPFMLVIWMGLKRIHKSYWQWLIPYTIILIVMALNPLNLTIFHGLFGFILHAGFFLAIFQYLSISKFINLNQINSIIIVLSISEIILGIIQYNLPVSHILNRYVVETDYLALVGEAVRVTGSFSYISGYGAFIVFWGMYLWGVAIQKRLPTPLLFFLLLLGFIAALMNGSRAILAIYVLLFFLCLFSAFSFNRLGNLFPSVVAIGLILTLNLGNINTTITQAIGNFSARIESNVGVGEQRSRIIGPLSNVIYFNGEYPFFGMGLGSTYQGANAIWGVSSTIKQYGYFEEEPERIVMEGGFLLFFFRIFLITILIYNMKIPVKYSVVVLILISLYLPIIFNIYNSTLFLLGLIYVDLSYQQASRQVQLIQQPPPGEQPT